MNLVDSVTQHLLEPAQLSLNHIEQVLGSMFSHSLDYADIYIQGSRNESWVLEDGIVKEGSYNIEKGLGIRGVLDEKTGFAYSDELALQPMQQAADTARGIAQVGQQGRIHVPSTVSAPAIYQPNDPLASFSPEQKIALLQQVDAHARSLDSRVDQVIVSLAGVYEEMLVMASDGTLAADIRPLVRMNCSVLLFADGRRERGSAGGGGRFDYQYFFELDENGTQRALSYAEEAVRLAAVNMEAIDAPAGAMPVVLGAGWPAVLLHEAVGHGLEGDFNRKGASAFSGKIGQRVTSPLCTIVDDATLSDRRGSLSVDDEGVVGQCSTLIENGILKGYMQDKLNARLMNTVSTGNGRRESYAHLPMPRMTNTYMLAGESEPDEIISSVKRGLYAPNFSGGQVDITSGKFVFSTSEAYLIEDGKLGAPVKGATLIGSGPETMQQVSMVGNDLKLDLGVGVCGKEGQSVPVGVGQPTLKVDQLTVGGSQG